MKMRNLICLLLAFILAWTLLGCGKTRTVSCDGCGKEIRVEDSSNITDEWILYCSTCETERFGEDGLVIGE